MNTEPSSGDVGHPAGLPEGMFLTLPTPAPGEHVPPIPVEFAVGLTDPDAKGRRWSVLRASDGTVTVDYRLPWQLGPQIGQQIADALTQMAAKAAAEENGGLVVPGRPPGGGLFVAAPGAPLPPRGGSPLTGGGR